MTFDCYLAMTAAEIAGKRELPDKIAWMACHFSPYGTGLSNLPTVLPPKSIIILNDRTPIHYHDPIIVAEQLRILSEELDAEAILLDFQRPCSQEANSIVRQVVETSIIPVGVTEPYAENANCPVFLSPPPLHMVPDEYFKKWAGREIWLEAALDAEEITVTFEGTKFSPVSWPESYDESFEDEKLICHYHTRLLEDKIIFVLSRTHNDLNKLLRKAKESGASKAIGLYQELGNL